MNSNGILYLLTLKTYHIIIIMYTKGIIFAAIDLKVLDIYWFLFFIFLWKVQ
jgi:hypothetical protein